MKKVRDISTYWRKYFVNIEYFNTWSSNMAYILGFITADGHIEKKSLTFCLNPKDENVLYFIRNEIGSSQPIKPCTFFNKKVKKYYTDLRLKISSTVLCKTLKEKFGLISHKTGNENICFDIPEEFKWDYIRGLFDGDGHVNINGSLSSNICSSSKIFINQLQSLCDMGVIYTSKEGMYSLNFGKDDSLIFQMKIYQNQNFRLQRKFDIFNSYILNTAKYSDYEIDLIRDNIDDLSKIIELTGRSEENLIAKAKKMHLYIPIYSKFLDYEIEFMIQNKGKLTNIQIAIELNRKTKSITSKFYSLKKQGKL